MSLVDDIAALKEFGAELAKLHRGVDENEKIVSEQEFATASPSKTTAHIKIKPDTIERLNDWILLIKDIERAKTFMQELDQSESVTDIESAMQNLGEISGMQDLLDWLGDFIEEFGDINDFVDGEGKLDWYGLVGMPDFHAKN